MDRSLHINLDDAPLAHRSLDAVLQTYPQWLGTPLKFPLIEIVF